MLHRRLRPARALALAAALAACQRPAAPAPAPAEPAVATPAPVPAPPSPPATVAALVKERAAVAPDGQVVALGGGDAPALVDRGASFRVVLSRRSPDARLSLLDAADAVVAAEGSRELAEGTTLTLRPSAPLVPAGTYQLRLDGAGSREVHDEAGAAFEPLSVTVLVAGEPAPPPAKKPAGKRRRH